MKKRLAAIPTSLLLTGAVWPVVTAAEEVESAESLDRNQDGYLSVAEAGEDSGPVENFARLDAKGDGPLDKNEPASKRAADENSDD